MPETGSERLFIHARRIHRCPRVGVAPDPGKLPRIKSSVDTAVEEVGHRIIQEANTHKVCLLRYADKVIDVKEIARRRDAEATDFGMAGVAKELELQPGAGREDQA